MPIGREMEQFANVALRLTNAQNSRMLPTTIAMSDDVRKWGPVSN